MLIVTYGCHLDSNESPRLSNEHQEIGFFTQAEVSSLNMPAGYKKSIGSWFARLAARS